MVRSLNKTLLLSGPALLLAACASSGPQPAARAVDGAAPLEPVTSHVSTIGDPPADPTVDLTDQPETLTASTTEDRSDDPNRLICRKMQRVGTHRRVEVCYTAGELEAMREETQQIMRNQRGARPDAEALNRMEELANRFPNGL